MIVVAVMPSTRTNTFNNVAPVVVIVVAVVLAVAIGVVIVVAIAPLTVYAFK
jgi:hypothetical protein